jgi:hypothetical protein
MKRPGLIGLCEIVCTLLIAASDQMSRRRAPARATDAPGRAFAFAGCWGALKKHLAPVDSAGPLRASCSGTCRCRERCYAGTRARICDAIVLTAALLAVPLAARGSIEVNQGLLFHVNQMTW